jgi:hypothetical protein
MQSYTEKDSSIYSNTFINNSSINTSLTRIRIRLYVNIIVEGANC